MVKDDFIEKIIQQKQNRISKLNINKYITIFESLYQTHSLIKTAQQLNMNISTISICLNNLENLIGENLFIRHGRNGIEITKVGHKFHSIASHITRNFEQITDNFISKIKTQQIHHTNIIKIFCNTLMANYYLIRIIPFLNKKVKNCSFYIEIGDREEGLKKLQKEETDIILFPMEWDDIFYYKNNFTIENIKPYNMELFINNQHKMANIYNDSITWDDLNEMQIMPINEKSRLNTANHMLTNINSNYITSSTDLMFLYEGIKQNLWSVGIGEEFAKLFDCSNIKIKQLSKAIRVQFSIFWFAIYDSIKQQKNIKTIKQIIEQIRQL